MRGLMMDRPLNLISILEHAALYHPDQQVVSRLLDGSIHRYGYADALARVKRLANALCEMGVRPGDRVATLAWSTYRHFELYYAVSGIGAVLHTINPRLHPDQVAWVVDHAEDAVLFYDLGFADLVQDLAGRGASLRTLVAMDTLEACEGAAAPGSIVYEELIRLNSPDFEWPEIDEREAAGLCYTSGTTGNPKGVLYSHRSTVLHAMACAMPDAFDLSARDVALPCAQMYHANAWGLPYTAPMVGARLVLPGRRLDGEALCELILSEGVTFLLGVPTIWVGLLEHVETTAAEITSVRTICIGGSAPSAAMVERIETRIGARARQIWGMTETSPLGVANTPLPGQVSAPEEAQAARKLKAGRALWGVEMRLIDDQSGDILPHDGESAGRLQVRGPWVAGAYFRNDGAQAFTDDGWFETGDIGAIDPDGFLRLTDRAKDVIKSGGEWISTLDLENAACAHPAVAMAAAIGMPHPKWDERPLLLVTLRSGARAEPEEIRAFVAGRVARWWAPDEVRIVAELPIGPTGKVLKRLLRDQLAERAAPEG